MGTGPILVVTEKMDLFYRRWKWREYCCSKKSTLTWGPSNVSVLDCVHHAFLRRKESYTNTSFHMKYPQNSARRKETFIFCFAIFLPFQRGVAIALDCDKEWCCADLTSSECGPSYPLCEGVYNAVLKRAISKQSIRWMENNVLESFILDCFIIWHFSGADSHLLV